MVTKQSESGTHAPSPSRADEESTTHTENATIETLTERCRKVASEVEKRLVTISLSLPSSADKHTKIIASPGSFIDQRHILVAWALRNGMNRLDDHRKPKPNSLLEKLLMNPKKSDEIMELLRGIEMTLGEMSEILEMLTRRHGADGSPPATDTGDQDMGPQLRNHVRKIAHYNKKLLQCTKTLGDPGLGEEDLGKLPDSDEDENSDEDETSDENDSIKTLAQSCVRDYFDVFDQFVIVSNDLFLAWIERNEAKSDEKITKLQGVTLDDAEKLCVEKIESPGSVFHQLTVFYNWANRNGVFMNGETSLDHRLRKPTPNMKDPLPNQRILAEQSEIIMEQFRNIKTTLGLMSEILTVKLKADEDVPTSESESEDNVYAPGMEPVPELRRHLDDLRCFNEKLLHTTEALGDPGPSLRNSTKVIESDGDVVEPENSCTRNRGTGKASITS